jgi:hypothetical protein
VTGRRADLAALTPEAVAALANLGLVKRAQRELAEGKGPTLEEDEAACVRGASPDGAVVTWPPGASLRDARCTCGATGACRHRVAVALAYAAFARAGASATVGTAVGPTLDVAAPKPTPDTTHDAKADTEADTEADTKVSASTARVEPSAEAHGRGESPPWSPSSLDDEALARALGKRTLEAARAQRARGLVVRARLAAGEPPTAALPTCTVRFFVPGELAFAKCDCVEGGKCAHVALACWAFREAERRGPLDGERTIELGASAGAEAFAELLPNVRELLAFVLAEGIVHASPAALAQRLALARKPLEARGLVWMVAALDELDEQAQAYHRKSARHRARRALELTAELEARMRAAARGGELPASFVLGQERALETKLEHLRLASLGARLEVDGDATTVTVWLANPDTGDVLTLERSLESSEAAPTLSAAGIAQTTRTKLPPPVGAQVAGRRLAGSTVGQLARGQVVTRAATRRFNGALKLGSQHGSTSVTPQSGDLSFLPPGLRVDGFAELEAQLAARPPAPLRPHRLGEGLRAVRVAGVQDVVFDPAEQAVLAQLVDDRGRTMLLVSHHTRGAPQALDALAAALTGVWGPTRWVVGEVAGGSRGLSIAPTLVVTDRVLVPALEADPPPLALPHGKLTGGGAALGRAVGSLVERLTELSHVGQRHLAPTFPARLRAEGLRVAELGLAGLAARVEPLASALERGAAASEPLADLAIRALLAAERLGV